jgi:hypothetical protein
VKLRADDLVMWNDVLMQTVHYENYVVFSRVTVLDTVLTYGYFGQVQTTDGIEEVFRKVRAAKAR